MSHFQDPLFEVPGFCARPLRFDDSDILQALLGKSPDYIQLVTGLPLVASAAYSLLTDRPEGKAASDKLVVGFFTEKQVLIGVLDMIRDYPAQGDWWLGLLLLDPEFRGQGLGQRIYSALEKWLTLYDVKRICLGVTDQNHEAYRFWQKVGFEPIERQPERPIEDTQHAVITMAHTLKS